MTCRTLSDEQIEALDFQTNQLYASFRRTVETQSLAMSLADAHDFTGIVEALGYVRIEHATARILKNTA